MRVCVQRIHDMLPLGERDARHGLWSKGDVSTLQSITASMDLSGHVWRNGNLIMEHGQSCLVRDCLIETSVLCNNASLEGNRCVLQ